MTVTDNLFDPTCFSQTNKLECWRKAIQEEMKAIKENNTWSLVKKED